ASPGTHHQSDRPRKTETNQFLCLARNSRRGLAHRGDRLRQRRRERRPVRYLASHEGCSAHHLFKITSSADRPNGTPEMTFLNRNGRTFLISWKLTSHSAQK